MNLTFEVGISAIEFAMARERWEMIYTDMQWEEIQFINS